MPRHRPPLEVPRDGGEIVLDDGSMAVAEPLGRGETYLVRRPGLPGARTARVKSLERAERRARELAIEQAALRQVTTLVARESSPERLFAVATEQVARVFDVPHVRLVRYEPDGSVVVGGFSERDHGPFPIGSRLPLDSTGAIAAVRQTGRAARVDDYGHDPGRLPRSPVVRACARPSRARSWSRDACGARWWFSRRGTSLYLKTLRRGSQTSPSSWRRRSPTPSLNKRERCSPTSRRRCGAWRRWSRRACRRTRCSVRCATRSRRSPGRRPPPWSVSRPTAR